MSNQSLPFEPNHYTVKEFQLIMRDSASMPAAVEPFAGKQYKSSLDVYQAFRQLCEMPVEVIICLHLDAKNRMVGMSVGGLGTLTSSLAHPREIFRAAVANVTSGMIFVHCHPSGDPTPSQDDISVTHRLCESGKILGIHCLDHVIIGAGRFFSFADEGML